MNICGIVVIKGREIHLKYLVEFIFLFFVFYLVGLFIPEGFDWQHFFAKGQVSSIWTPWSVYILKFLNFPFLVALTLLALVIRTRCYSKSPFYAGLAIISLPTLWVLLLGNLDGLVLMGLLILPWGMPLVLMKPQLSAFALLSKRSNFIFAVIWIVISLVLWGFWPLRFLSLLTPEWKADWAQDISLFPWGLIIAVPLLWFSRGDEDKLMAAGSFATPHLFPYHFILLMPSLARMKPIWAFICWALSWTPLLANWLGPVAWHLGNLFALFTWLGLSFFPKKEERTSSLVPGQPGKPGESLLECLK